MAISPKCIARLNQAAGRALTQAQLDEIENRMRRTATALARRDINAWRTMTRQERVLAAAQQAMADIRAEASLKVERARLQALKTEATDQRIEQLQRTFKDESRSAALVRDMQNTENYAHAVHREYAAQLLDTIDAATSGQGAGVGRRAAMFLFDVDNPAMTRDLALEIFGGADGRTGNALARRGAKAWLDTIEQMRQRFNRAGGDVGQLEYGYIPQPHDQLAVLRAGRDKWAADTLPLLDRSRYLRDDGSRMSDEEVLTFLRGAWETIATGGQNKVEPGAFRGTGMRANRGSQSREIHFAGGEHYLQYLRDYGAGSMYDAMMGHVSRAAKDIALVEQYGPNPANQLRLQLDLAQRADGGIRRQFGVRPESYAELLLGDVSAPAGTGTLAAIGQEVRGVQTAGKLAGALLSSLPDLGTYFVTTGFHRLPYWQAIRNIRRARSKDAVEFMNMHGLMADSLLSEINRWTAENARRGVFTRLANSTMRLSLLNAWTDGLRRAFGLTMMHGLARMRGTPWETLTEFDRFRLESKGITEADWSIVNRAEAVRFRGLDMLTPEAVRAVDDPGAQVAATKVLALIQDESEFAIVNPDLATRAIATGGLQAGTVKGELWRAGMQFKSFPIAMISRHWRRAFDMPEGLSGAPMMGNRVAYLTALGVSVTMLGAVSYQAKQIVQGKDPVDMASGAFWARAAAQGGAAGFFGDLLLADSTEDRSPGEIVARLAGPTLGGTLPDLMELTKGNIDEALAGKDTHAGAEVLRFGKSHLPYVNLWYAKGIIERSVLNDIQENLSPGYLKRMKKRAAKQWGQDYWWDPAGGVVPQRAPDLGKAVGQ